MKWYKNIWFYVAAMLCMAACYAFYTARVKEKQHVRWQQQLGDSLRYYKRKDGKVHAVATVQQIPEHLYKHIADSIVQAVAKGTKAKDLVQHSTVNTATANRDTVLLRDTVVVTGTDTAAGHIFNFDDGALQLTGLIANNSADINYSMSLHLSHTTRWERPGLFKKKVLVVDAYSNTPHTTITGMQSFVVQQPPKKFYETKGFAFALGTMVGILTATSVK